MKNEIRRYVGKCGAVTVQQYEENGRIEYHVLHTGIESASLWCLDKVEAIKHAQFLAGKY